MIKIFTLLNVAGLFLFNMLFVDDVSVKQDLPASMDPGTEVRVTVTIDKGNVSGFAKLQLDLPPGLSATAIETKGASFTFAEGKAKFIWMALPTQPSFTVSYTLGAAANAGGTLAVNGRFSYIEDNERKMVDLQPGTVRLSGDAPALAAEPKPAFTAPVVTPTETENTAITETPVITEVTNAVSETINNDNDGTPIPDATIPTTPGMTALQGPGNVSASRTVTPVNDNEALVEVLIRKGSLRGFGKLQENIPAGFSAVATESDDAIFSAKGTTAKFVWLNLPQKNDIKVVYRLVANGSGKGEHTVNGEFGYLVNDLTQRAVVGSSTFTLGTAAVAQQVEKPAPTVVAPAPKSEVVKPEPVKPVTAEKIEPTKPAPVEKTVTVKSEPVVKQAAPATASASKVTSMSGPEKGITYKVQITAAHREVGKEYFEQRHHYSGDFSIEHNDGWIKYVTGMFDRYNSAKAQRQEFLDSNYNFPGPFVTAYNNGERITVQEAMMIAKQNSAQ
ncbi:MAG: hypothetical protein WBO28_15580 [Flavobacteriales bacterium]|jgi:hypothetical protein